jgi:hypothetical protein
VTDFKNYPLRSLDRSYWHLPEKQAVQALGK